MLLDEEIKILVEHAGVVGRKRQAVAVDRPLHLPYLTSSMRTPLQQ